MQIAIPNSLREFVKERVEEKRYEDASDYIAALIREDKKRRDEERLERVYLQGTQSGKGVSPKKRKEFDAICREFRDRMRKRATDD